MWLPWLTAIVAVAYAFARSRRPGGIEINHVTTFTAGYLFYWWLPSLLGIIPIPDVASGLTSYLNQIPTSRIFGYGASILACYLAFASGDLLGTHPIIRARRSSRRPRTFESKLWRAEWIIVLLIFLGACLKDYDVFFQAYSENNLLVVGTLVAISLVLFSVSLRFGLEDRWGFMVGYFICAVVLLTIGGRLYFVSSILTLLIYFSHRKPIRTKVLLIGGVAAICLMGIIGVLRMHTPASILLIFLNVATESLFTSFSLFSYLHANPIAWIKAPAFLLGDLYNLIPSALVNKQNLQTLADSHYEISSPVGAMNSWVSFNVNFGLVGTVVFLFLFGYLMRRHEKLTVPYLMLTGFIAFTFFRDPFSVSLVKNMLEFSLLIPLFLESLNTWVGGTVRHPAKALGNLAAKDRPLSP